MDGFKWMVRHNHILYNPASDIELPRLEHRLPKCVLTPSEVDQVINQCNINDPFGLRDRAILETFYSTGIRRMEMINLRPFDLDAERGILMVPPGQRPPGSGDSHWRSGRGLGRAIPA